MCCQLLMRIPVGCRLVRIVRGFRCCQHGLYYHEAAVLPRISAESLHGRSWRVAFVAGCRNSSLRGIEARDLQVSESRSDLGTDDAAIVRKSALKPTPVGAYARNASEICKRVARDPAQPRRTVTFVTRGAVARMAESSKAASSCLLRGSDWVRMCPLSPGSLRSSAWRATRVGVGDLCLTSYSTD